METILLFLSVIALVACTMACLMSMQRTATHVHIVLPGHPSPNQDEPRSLYQQAAGQIEAKGHSVDWRVVEDKRERLPATVQPRLGNARNEIVRR